MSKDSSQSAGGKAPAGGGSKGDKPSAGWPSTTDKPSGTGRDNAVPAE